VIGSKVHAISHSLYNPAADGEYGPISAFFISTGASFA
jgi:hypothetical protein